MDYGSPLDWLDLDPEIPSSTTSMTVAVHSLSCNRYGWCRIQVRQQQKAATIDECRSLECAGGLSRGSSTFSFQLNLIKSKLIVKDVVAYGLEHWVTMKSQSHLTVLLHSNAPLKGISVLASPVKIFYQSSNRSRVHIEVHILSKKARLCRST